MLSRSLLLTVLDTSGETCRAWTGRTRDSETCWRPDIGHASYIRLNVVPPPCFRPLCASGMDKLELQDCLEHGRVAKVWYPQNKDTPHKSYLQLLGCTCLSVYLLFYSSGRCVPSRHAPTPSNRGRINTSLSWWTGRRTYCGALSWRGEQHTHTHL